MTWHIATGNRKQDIYPLNTSFGVVGQAHKGVVVPYITIGNPSVSPDLVRFGKNKKMYPIDPDAPRLQNTDMPDRWPICHLKTFPDGYANDTLAWQSGMGAPVEKSCKFAGLPRVWMKGVKEVWIWIS